MNKQKISIRDLCFIALMVAVVTVLAQLTVPMPLGVPLSLQTFAVMLTGIILGAKRAAIALIVYLLLGAVGIQVFVQFGSGFQRIIGPWGGYLMSYPFVAFIIGFGADTGKKHWLAVCLAAGALVNLSMGTLWHSFQNEGGLAVSFAACFMPFVIPEVIKIIMAFSVGLPVRYALKRIKEKGTV
ncbi:MAG: biotin transporter BioY [Oscillospiraceae bacterium]|nr:biotin transporter BioY [Oscillospiraceae bacterium]